VAVGGEAVMEAGVSTGRVSAEGGGGGHRIQQPPETGEEGGGKGEREREGLR
jgi:hypothetical protein